MKIFKHSGHNAYEFTKKLVVIKNKDKIKFRFKGHGFANFRFIIHPCRNFQYFHWLIRTPIFYWEKNNGGFEIGLPNLYLWVIR